MNKIIDELWHNVFKPSDNLLQVLTAVKIEKSLLKMQAFNHLISCSRFLKVSVSKKSAIEISRPSQIFLIVVMLGFLL